MLKFSWENLFTCFFRCNTMRKAHFSLSCVRPIHPSGAHTHTHTLRVETAGHQQVKRRSQGWLKVYRWKKRSGPTSLTSFAFHPPAFVAWLSIWHLYCRRNLFSHFLFSPDFVFLLSVFFFIGFVAGEKGNVGSRSDRKHNGGCLCVCAITTF
jgi:hypothetical protein